MLNINGHYKNEITLQLLADHVHINGSYLRRLFKKKTGDTLTDAITKIRLEKAKELLVTSHLKTYKIASAVGIEDAA